MPKIDYSKINKNAVDTLQYVDKQLEAKGYGYYQRLAILGNIQRESSGNPLAVSKNGTWHGLIQWDKDRYRIKSNDPKKELETQTALLLNELEKKGWSGWTWKDQVANSDKFKNAKSLQEAVDIFTRHFVRPGNMEDEIRRRFNFANLGVIEEPDPEYDTGTAVKVLPSELVSAWRRDPEKNHLSTGYTDERGNYHYLKSSQHESYPESREFERKDEPSSKAMIRYIRANNYASKFPTYSPATSGLPKSVYGIGYGQDLVYKPMVLKNQRGGLVYTPFLRAQNSNKTKEEDIDLSDFLDTSASYPVEPVQIYKPSIEESQESINNQPVKQGTVEYADSIPTSNPTSTQSFHEETTPSIVRGTIEFKHNDIDVGNMQELIDLMSEEGISFRITSGSRAGAKTKSGKLSHHGSGNALDITPIKGQTWDDLLSQMRCSKRFIDYMDSHGLGILDERSKEMQKKTGATGEHFHIGPDQIARTQFKYLIKHGL